jgi:hypothetical protein
MEFILEVVGRIFQAIFHKNSLNLSLRFNLVCLLRRCKTSEELVDNLFRRWEIAQKLW